MEHEDAIRTLAVERYSLDEMTLAEAEQFEEHYFDCGECWADVWRAEVFAQSMRVIASLESPQPQPIPRPVVEPQPSNVLPFRTRLTQKLASFASAAAMVVVLGFVPARMWIQSHYVPAGEVPNPLFVKETMRGDASTNVLPAGKWATLLFDILPVDGAADYHVELRGPGDTRQLDVTPQKATHMVLWLLRPLPPGSYELVIQSVDRGGNRSEIARQSIQVGGGS